MEEVVVYNINGKDYLVTNQIDYKNNIYLYLSNVHNARDIILRKIKVENKTEYIVKLEEDEFDDVMREFFLKNENLF